MFKKSLFACLVAVIASSSLMAQEDEKPLRGVQENGKIFIIDEDGNKQEVDIQGARSFTIRQSNKVVNENGDEQREVQGQAVIIDQNGETTVIDLTEGNFEMPQIDIPGIELDFQVGGMDNIQIEEIMPAMQAFDRLRNRPGVFRLNSRNVGKYMIGVNCNTASDTLRSHLRLDDGLGLVVQSVTNDSPASEAGLQQHDILLFADDQQLGSLDELTKAVERAGEEDREVNVTFIREGEEQSAQLKPIERSEKTNLNVQNLQIPGGMGNIQLQRLGPGIIIDDANQQFDEAIQQLRLEMERMRQEMRNNMRNLNEDK